MSELLEEAVRLAEAGIPVFPCIRGQKEPATKNGFHNATSNVASVRRAWEKYPEMNIGVPTGSQSWDVLDVDNKPDGDGFPALRKLLATDLLNGAQKLIYTPSGGMHLYFPGTDQPCSKLRGRFVDFKAEGGYVLVPPSRWEGHGAYVVKREVTGEGAPLDWDAVLQVFPPEKAPPRARKGKANMESLTEWLRKQTTEGERNASLFWAACRAVESGIGDLTPLHDVALEIGLTEEEVRKTLASAETRYDE